MLQYVVKRVALAGVVVLLVLVLLSVAVNLIPGSAAQAILGSRATPELVQSVEAEMGLDRPPAEQVWRFVADALRGDLGNDLISHAPVSQLIGDVLPDTLYLALAALLIGIVVGLVLGTVAALRPGSLVDRAVMLISVVLITVPVFVVSLMLILVFAINLKVLPTTGAGDATDPLDYLRHLLLPALSMSLPWAGYLARLVRSAMVEVLASEYVRTARAYGLKPRTLLVKYALKNASIPLVAVLGVGLGSLMGGALFAEIIFNRPGLGSVLYFAIQQRNFPVVRGTVAVVSILFILANLAADLSYQFLDPRVRLARKGA